jgi:hypothetical protein
MSSIKVYVFDTLLAIDVSLGFYRLHFPLFYSQPIQNVDYLQHVELDVPAKKEKENHETLFLTLYVGSI